FPIVCLGASEKHGQHPNCPRVFGGEKIQVLSSVFGEAGDVKPGQPQVIGSEEHETGGHESPIARYEDPRFIEMIRPATTPKGPKEIRGLITPEYARTLMAGGHFENLSATDIWAEIGQAQMVFGNVWVVHVDGRRPAVQFLSEEQFRKIAKD